VEHSPACRVWSQCHERASNARGAATRLETLGVYILQASVMTALEENKPIASTQKAGVERMA
jgi:hypothetical protein